MLITASHTKKKQKKKQYVHYLGDGNNLEIKEYQLIMLLHIRITHTQISDKYTQAVQCIRLMGVQTD